jgi:hypothetical protein
MRICGGALSEWLSGRASLDGNDCLHARKDSLQGLFDADAQGCELGRTDRAGSLKMNPHRSVLVDVDELDVSAVGDEAWANAVEQGLDFFSANESGLQLHRLQIGKTRVIIE